jgi:hypothetical protein
LGIDNQNFGVNNTGKDYASWTFRKAPSFFDVVMYTGTGASGLQIPHNLGVAPGMILIKCPSVGYGWIAGHVGAGWDKSGVLNNNEAFGPNASAFNSTAPTDSVFTLGNSPGCNQDEREYVAYLFAHDDSDEGMIQCGSYSGKATVDLGWEPQWLLVKKTNGAENWQMVDNMRGLPTGGNIALLRANTPDAEVEDSPRVRFTSTGFEVTSTNSDWGSGDFIYTAIRRPNKPAEEFEADKLFAIDQSQSAPYIPGFQSGFPVDMAFYTSPGSSGDRTISSRLTQTRKLATNSSNADENKATLMFDYMNGWYADANAALSSWMWRRAPGFFDVVAYDGINPSGSSPQTIQHSLGVKPEMMWIKARDQAYSWTVYHSAMGADRYLRLNELVDRKISSEAFWDTEPTDEVFTVGDDNAVNNNLKPYIAYLFASVDGISKIGSYVGNGVNDGPVVYCGFSPRLILIKSIDSNGNWVLLDTVRGIAIPPNSLCGVVHLDDNSVQPDDSLVDPAFEGFKVTNGSGKVNGLNKSYLFYAIA